MKTGCRAVLLLAGVASASAGPLVDPGGIVRSIIADPIRPVFYATLQSSNEVVKIDIASASVVARVPLPGEAGLMAIESDGSRLYVGLRTTYDVGVVDLAGPSYSGTIDLSSTGTGPYGMVTGRPGRLYVSSRDGLSVVDTTSSTEIYFGDAGTSDLRFWKYHAAMSPDDRTLYLLDEGVGPASLLAVSVEDDCPYYVGEDHCHGCIGGYGRQAQVSPDGARVYVVTGDTYHVQVLSPVAMFHTSHRILSGAFPDAVVPATLSNNVYVGRQSAELCIADAASLLVFRAETLQGMTGYQVYPNLALSSGEDVVAAVIEIAGSPDRIELVDVSSPVPNLGGIKLRPVDSVTGLPIHSASGDILGTIVYSEFIDVDQGLLGVGSVPPGSYTLDVEAGDYQSETRAVSVVAGQWTDLGTVPMTRTGPLAPPRDSSVSQPLVPGATMDVVIHGLGFESGGQFGVTGGSLVTVNSFSYQSWSTIHANVTVSPSITVGPGKTLMVTNADGQTDGADAVVAAIPVTLSPTSLPDGAVGIAYSQTIVASGGGTYTFTVTSGALPPGLSLSTSGLISGTPTLAASYGFTVTAADAGGGCSGSQSYDVTISGGTGTPAEIVAGAGLGQPNPNRVRALEQDGSATSTDFIAYGAGQWGVNVARADLTGASEDQILTGPGPGSQFGPQVRGFLASGTPMGKINYFAYGTLKYGVNVAAGDVEDDGFDEVVSGAGPGDVFGPHVRGWNYDEVALAPIAKINFFAYGTLKYGVNPASGSIDADASAELASGAGPGQIFGPQVRGFNFDGLALTAIAKVNFNAFTTSEWGVNLATADADGDGFAEIACAPGPGPNAAFPARLVAFDYDGAAVAALPGYDVTLATGTTYGGRVGLGDVTGDGQGDLLGGEGRDPAASGRVHPFHYTGSALVPLLEVDAFPGQAYGVNATGGMLGL